MTDYPLFLYLDIIAIVIDFLFPICMNGQQLETFGSFTTYRANKSICCRKNRIIKNEVKFPAFPLQITQALEVPPLPFLLIWRLAGTSMLPHQIGFENIAVM